MMKAKDTLGRTNQSSRGYDQKNLSRIKIGKYVTVVLDKFDRKLEG